MNNVAYCIKCKKDVEFIERVEAMEIIIEGVKVLFIGKAAYCPACGESLFIDDIVDYNIDAAQEAYRKQMGLISRNEILLIMEKYNIKKRPLSMLLGWGEITFTRFCSGSIPRKYYSDELKELLYNEQKYLEKLERFKKRISSVAYKKSKKAVLALTEVKSKKEDILESKEFIQNYYTLTSNATYSSNCFNPAA